jgi:hypothetical protein
MKPKCVLFIFFILFTVNGIHAQSRSCDEIISKGDTLICKDYLGKNKFPFDEHFYVDNTRIFTRRWLGKKNGEFECTQYKSAGAFAKMNGPAYHFYQDGAVKATTFMEHDKVIGPCRAYYQSGSLKQKCEGHLKGKVNGIMTTFHENGQVNSKTRWENGRLREILVYKDELGIDLPIGTFKDGNGIWNLIEKGDPAILYQYKDGKVINKKTLK